MTRFRVLVADDEPLARRMVADILRGDPEIDEVVECEDAVRARDELARGRADILFLDIEMPGMTGLELAAALRADELAVVFITAFGQYALTAFDVDATDYVLKPFSDARLLEALERAKRRVRERRLRELADRMAALTTELKDDARGRAAGSARRVPLKPGEGSVFHDPSDIFWIEAEDYYVRVHAKTGRRLVRVSLTSLEQRLDPRAFMRVHRRAIVNVDHVREACDEGGLVLVLSDGSRVPVSRSRRSAVESKLLPRLGAPRG